MVCWHAWHGTTSESGTFPIPSNAGHTAAAYGPPWSSPTHDASAAAFRR